MGMSRVSKLHDATENPKVQFLLELAILDIGNIFAGGRRLKKKQLP